jgi:hypothetical protein
MVAPYDYRREIVTQTERAKLTFTAVNSTLAYVLAYLCAYVFYQLVTSSVAASLNIKSVVYYHKIDYRVAADFWNRFRVIYTFASGPVACLILGIVGVRIYTYLKKNDGYIRLFLLWLYLHAFNLFFGSYVAGVVTQSGFRYVTNYAQVPKKLEYVIAFFCVAAMFAFGYFATKQFLQMAPSQSLIQRFSRRTFVLCVCILPWLVGSSLLTLFKRPNITPNELIVYLMIFTIVVPVLVVQRNFQEVNLVKRSKQLGISWGFLATTLIALVVFRYVFEYGLKMGY